MSRIMYGTAWKKDQTARLVEKAVAYGFGGIDTACQLKHYHEAAVGEALAALQAQANPHILESRVVQELALIHRKTEAHIFFRYLTQIGIMPLTGTTSDQHMQEDLAIFDFEIAADAMPRGSRLCWFEMHQPRGFT
jgi:diketogulonate reductase-like aldo/keto reductase